MIGDELRRAGPDYGAWRNGGPYGACIHDLEAPIGANVRSLVDWANGAKVSPHTMADLNRIVQLLDERRSGAHCGSRGNALLVGFEVTGYASWSTAQWMSDIRNLLNQARAVAGLWRVMGWSPTDVRWGSLAELKEARRRFDAGLPPAAPRLWTHNDVSEALGGTDHWDPGRGFPFDRFTKWVLEYLVGKGQTGTGGTPTQPSGGGQGGAEVDWFANATVLEVALACAGR